VGSVTWGLLGPEQLASERRTRTLGLGATVRSFNDLAVPGLGGVWFGKQLLLATLGIAVAENLRDSGRRSQNIEVANAVEAMACRLALQDKNSLLPDPRLRGTRKLVGKDDLSFATVRRPSFYVTQPMRQATVQPLRALGLVESNGERFNAFRCTERGEDFIEEGFLGCRPHSHSVLHHLLTWANQINEPLKTSPELTRALSPLQPMPSRAREFLRERVIQGGATEAYTRRKAMDWVETLRGQMHRPIEWDEKPAMLDEPHWRDLHAGALFFATRDAAITLLDEIESHIGNARDRRLSLNGTFPGNITDKIESLREHSKNFLADNYQGPPRDEAAKFCRECTEPDAAQLLTNLLLREGHVLKLQNHDIVPSVAFKGSPVRQPEEARSSEEDGMETQVTQLIPLPEGISHRVPNLFLLNLDLHNELEPWLHPVNNNGGES